MCACAGYHHNMGVRFMTLRQEAYEKLTVLPESGLRIILAVADEIIRQNQCDSQRDSNRIKSRQTAVETIFRMRQESPVPPDFDWEKAREEAMLEKYGYFM